MMDNHPFDEDTDLMTGDEIVMDLNYTEICHLMKGLFVSQYPEHDHTDLLVKVSLDEESIQATFKLCPNHILSMAHRERGKRLDS